MKWRGRIGTLLLALAVVAGIGYGFMPRPQPVELAQVAKGALAVTVDEEGRTRVRDRYVVAAPAAGHARRISLKVGDRVAAGQEVARIEPARAASLDPRSRAQAADTGIPALLRRLNELHIDFKDLHTEQSPLEDIFVSLVHAK